MRRVGMIAVTAFALSLAGSASAQAPQYDKRGRPVYGGGPNVVYQQGPHTRIYVSKRSWLDGGTEVLPGDRKFTDYAYPPGSSFARAIPCCDQAGLHRNSRSL